MGRSHTAGGLASPQVRFLTREVAGAMSESSSNSESFQALIARVRAGDEQAAAELVRHYEPAIRRAARVRLVDSRLNRLLDSMDICQSVMASFFVRAALGQYELDTPDQLLKLLATMTRNKLAGQVKGHGAARRDFRRVAAAPTIATLRRTTWPSGSPGMTQHPAAISRRASCWKKPCAVSLPRRNESWIVANAGTSGFGIATELRSSPEAIRKRLARAVDRVALELGLDESP